MIEFSPSFIAICIIGFVVGIPIIVFCINAIKRLHYLKKTNLKIEGELFVSTTGEVFSEFGIPIDEIVNRDYILLKVVPIKTTKEENSNGNISAETHKT